MFPLFLGAYGMLLQAKQGFDALDLAPDDHFARDCETSSIFFLLASVFFCLFEVFALSVSVIWNCVGCGCPCLTFNCDEVLAGLLVPDVPDAE